jgi:hypothetical protein
MCRFGDRCRFDHGGSPSRKRPSEHTPSSSKSARYSGRQSISRQDMPCFAFVTKGSCSRNPCKYSHNPSLRGNTPRDAPGANPRDLSTTPCPSGASCKNGAACPMSH